MPQAAADPCRQSHYVINLALALDVTPAWQYLPTRCARLKPWWPEMAASVQSWSAHLGKEERHLRRCQACWAVAGANEHGPCIKGHHGRRDAVRAWVAPHSQQGACSFPAVAGSSLNTMPANQPHASRLSRSMLCVGLHHIVVQSVTGGQRLWLRWQQSTRTKPRSSSCKASCSMTPCNRSAHADLRHGQQLARTSQDSASRWRRGMHRPSRSGLRRFR